MISGLVDFVCPKADLDYVATLISERLTGKKDGLAGREDYVRDEIPTVYSDIFLGLKIYLMQNPEEPTEFQIDITDKIYRLVDERTNISDKIDISSRIYALLKSYEELIFPEEYKVQWPLEE